MVAEREHPREVSGSGHVRVGTSGWHYEHWRGAFYPADVPPGQWLDFYVEQFDTVEINNTFYRLPAESTFEAWHEAAPPGFVFAVKASRYITHMKKLRDPEEPLANFVERAGLLGDRLGPILFQLPPRWSFNPQRLASFLAALPPGYRYAFELRDPSWLNERTYGLLAAHNAALCIYELAGQRSPRQVTADFVYVRLHGPGGAYEGRYSTQALGAWADDMTRWAAQGCDVYCYFDNDQAGYAAQNALEMQQMLRAQPAEG